MLNIVCTCVRGLCTVVRYSTRNLLRYPFSPPERVRTAWPSHQSDVDEGIVPCCHTVGDFNNGAVHDPGVQFVKSFLPFVGAGHVSDLIVCGDFDDRIHRGGDEVSHIKETRVHVHISSQLNGVMGEINRSLIVYEDLDVVQRESPYLEDEPSDVLSKLASFEQSH